MLLEGGGRGLIRGRVLHSKLPFGRCRGTTGVTGTPSPVARQWAAMVDVRNIEKKLHKPKDSNFCQTNSSNVIQDIPIHKALANHMFSMCSNVWNQVPSIHVFMSTAVTRAGDACGIPHWEFAED